MNKDDEDSHQQWRIINEVLLPSDIAIDCWIPLELFDFFNEGDLFTIGQDPQVFRARRKVTTHD